MGAPTEQRLQIRLALAVGFIDLVLSKLTQVVETRLGEPIGPGTPRNHHADSWLWPLAKSWARETLHLVHFMNSIGLPVLRAGLVQDICVRGFTQLLQSTGVWSVRFSLCFRQTLPHLEGHSPAGIAAQVSRHMSRVLLFIIQCGSRSREGNPIPGAPQDSPAPEQ